MIIPYHYDLCTLYLPKHFNNIIYYKKYHAFKSHLKGSHHNSFLISLEVHIVQIQQTFCFSYFGSFSVCIFLIGVAWLFLRAKKNIFFLQFAIFYVQNYSKTCIVIPLMGNVKSRVSCGWVFPQYIKSKRNVNWKVKGGLCCRGSQSLVTLWVVNRASLTVYKI